MGNDLQQRLEEALSLMEEQRKECARLTTEMTELGRHFLESEEALATTRRELAEARRELAERESVEKQLREYDSMLTGIESMKLKYEKRISVLEARLRDARIKSEREAADEIIGTIDMRASGKENRRRYADAAMRKEAGTRSVETIRMEETPVALPDTDVKGESRQNILPEDLPDPKSADDWLLGLPDNL